MFLLRNKKNVSILAEKGTLPGAMFTLPLIVTGTLHEHSEIVTLPGHLLYCFVNCINHILLAIPNMNCF